MPGDPPQNAQSSRLDDILTAGAALVAGPSGLQPGSSTARKEYMQRPLVTFRGMTPSAGVQRAIEHWVGRLDHVSDRLQRCTVVIEQPHLHHRRGNEFSVHVDLSVPGKEFAIRAEDADVYVAVADAFRTARRQLQEYAESRRDSARHAV